MKSGNCCKYCGENFIKNTNRQKFCSRHCQEKSKQRRYKNNFNHTCLNCASYFTSARKNSKCCSSHCAAKYRSNTRTTKTCVECKGSFKGKSKQLFCSGACRRENFKKHPIHELTCVQCGCEFKAVTKNRKYCSYECHHNSRVIGVAECENCRKKFNKKRNRMNRFCKRECFYEKLGYNDQSESKYQSRLTDASHIKKAKKLGVIYERIDPMRVFIRDEWTCGICGDKVDDTLVFPNPKSASLDHIQPISLGGTHTYDNVQCSHFGCNAGKSNRLVEGEGGQLEMF